MYFFLAFELNIIFRIFLRVRYFHTILALPVVDPGGPSMCLYSGPVSYSGVNEGLVPSELFFVFFIIIIYRTITYTTYSTNILFTCIHYLQYTNCNAIILISLFTMQFSIIEKLHVYIQVTQLLHFF